MIIVNVNKTSPGHGVRASAASSWLIAEWRLNRFGDYLVAVERNVVVGVFKIDGWSRKGGAKGPVTFDLTEVDLAPGAVAVGDPSPDPWLAGQRWPVKYLSTEALVMRTAASVAVSAVDVLVPGLTITLDGAGIVTVTWDATKLLGEVKVGAERGVVELWPYVPSEA